MLSLQNGLNSFDFIVNVGDTVIVLFFFAETNYMSIKDECNEH